MREKIIFVDEEDYPIGIGTREEAWKKGIYVRIVRAVILDENGRVLSQYRSPTKKSYPSRWTDSASGHVDEGDTYDSAVHRELEEELGIKTKLSFVTKFKSKDIIDNKTILQFNAVYEGHIKSSMPLILQESEVAKVAWCQLKDLKKLMKNNPGIFMPEFVELIHRLY